MFSRFGAVFGALLISRSVVADVKVSKGYIAVPGGLSCPRNCHGLDTMDKCQEGANELGLPCGEKRTVKVAKTAAIAAMATPTDRYNALLGLLGVTLHGAVVATTTMPSSAPLLNTEMEQIWWLDAGLQAVIQEITNKTDESSASIIAAWEAAPLADVWVSFKMGCVADYVAMADKKNAMGGCSFKNGQLWWNNMTSGGKFDVNPWEQTPEGKNSAPGMGSKGFRLCQCTALPPYLAVVHSKCAPRCRSDFDPCSQHPGCKRISQWSKCQQAGQDLQWYPKKGNDATPAGTVGAAFAEWNSNFDAANWQANRGTPGVSLPPTGPLCTLGQATPCLTNPMWGDNGVDPAEWTTSGLTGAQDRYCQFINDTAPGLESSFSSTRWLNHKSGAYSVLAPPPLNFMGDIDGRKIPSSPYSQFWDPPTAFLNNAFATPEQRPQGCTFDAREEFDVFYPWNTLRMRTTPKPLTGQQCCPPGTYGVSCFVEHCTLAPCLETGAGEECQVHAPGVEDLFEMCECTNDTSASNDECVFFGQPCGAGQTCTDNDHSNEPDPSNPQYECSCTKGGVTTTATGAPAVCNEPLNIKFVAKPAGRGCGECSRVSTPQQCDAAAAALSLADTTHTVDPIAHRRTRPCGCHYSEHGSRCTGDSGECLRWNPVYGDGVFNGCDAYENADAHDFLICACNASMPSYVAEPLGTCRQADGCRVIDNKQDCRAAAEFIGMHLAVHEEQEALLLLNSSVLLSKQQHNNYLGADGNTYQHNDDGLGPVVGDGPTQQSTRPAGCHYRRRFDADILPDGATVNWPHLLFNPLLSSAVPATTQDMLLCDCTGNPSAPTPAPTDDITAFAALRGFVAQGGRCVYPGGADIPERAPESSSFMSTFQTCIDTCAAAVTCRGADWQVNPADTVDREGIGKCTHINHCAVQDRPCQAIDTVPMPGHYCLVGPDLTPAPTPVPSFPESHFGGECKSFCCMQHTQEKCCGGQAGTGCPFGPNGGYCSWTGNNTCERNCYEREGPCAMIELCFNLTGDWNQTELDAKNVQLAKDANLLIGGVAGAIEPVSITVDPVLGIVTSVLKCPAGGCGSRQYIVDELCFNGVDVPTPGGDRVKKSLTGECLVMPPGGFTEEMPKAELAGWNPFRVTASACQCVPTLKQSVMNWQGGSWVEINMPHTLVTVNSSTHAPAWSDSPPINELCDVPQAFHGLNQFHMGYSAEYGAQFNLSCPGDCNVCDLHIVHYHQPPCSSDVNGGLPATLPNDGWTPSSCAPCMTNGTDRWNMVGYRKQIRGGEYTITPPVATACLKYFSIFAGPGVWCEDNELQTETACLKAGGVCAWKDGACVSDFCPRPATPTTSPPTGPARVPGAPTRPPPCVLAPGAECVDPPTKDQVADRLDQLP